MCIAMNLPRSLDLREKYDIRVVDQGEFGSDVACSIATAVVMTTDKELINLNPDSKLFQYYMERETDVSNNT